VRRAFVAAGLLALAACGGDPGPCPAATFAAHDGGTALPCSSGERGYFKSWMQIGTATGIMKIPVLSCGAAGAAYSVQADGQDANVLTVQGHASLDVCSYQGPGRYGATGARGIALALQTSRTEPTYRSAPDTECEVCINPDGVTGEYSCRMLHRDGDVAQEQVDASGSFSCAP